jgi:hypothetical protein
MGEGQRVLWVAQLTLLLPVPHNGRPLLQLLSATSQCSSLCSMQRRDAIFQHLYSLAVLDI